MKHLQVLVAVASRYQNGKGMVGFTRSQKTSAARKLVRLGFLTEEVKEKRTVDGDSFKVNVEFYYKITDSGLKLLEELDSVVRGEAVLENV